MKAMSSPVLRANLRSSGKRLWAAGAAIAISVAFIVAGLLVVDSFNRAITEEAQQDAAGTDLIVGTHTLNVWDDEEDAERIAGQDVGLASEIAALGSVESAEPVREESDAAGPADSPLAGSIEVVLPDQAHEDAEDQEAARDEIISLIDQLVASGQLEVPGVEPDSIPHGTDYFGVPTVAGFDVATQQDVIDQWIEMRAGSADALAFVTMGFGGIALFVSAMVIANTFQVIVASRAKTIALLRVIGATPGQLKRATLSEGAILGLIGGTVGVLLGWGAAFAFSLVGRATFAETLPLAVFSPAAVAIGLALGLTMTVLASLLPALKAGRVAPMQALRPVDVTPAERGVSSRRIAGGALMFLVGQATVLYAALAASDAGRDPLTGAPMPLVGLLGGILGFLGMLLLARIVVPPSVAWCGRMLARVRPVRTSAWLAGKNARQAPGRTTATASALLVGVTLVVTMLVGAATVQSLLEEEFTDDSLIDTVLGVALLLLAASVLVAVIGVSNTLSLSVFERRREAALLRAVGMSRRAVGTMVALEALLLAGVALLLGTALGVFFGWAGVNSLLASDDMGAAVQLPWLRLGLVWAATLLAALLAAWLPARRLSRTEPAEGLAA